MNQSAIRIVLLLSLLGLSILPLPAFAQCAGDCDGDRAVSINELIRGVNLALGRGALSECSAADANGDGQVRVTDLIAAVNAALAGCPPSPTATTTGTATATPTATDTSTPTATSTATPTVNLPPQIGVAAVYRSLPDEPIEYPVAATDPEGGAVACTASNLPDGASFDPETETIDWTPSAEQAGAYEIGLACEDDAGAAAATVLPLRIAPLDSCTTVADCDPASGCATELVSIDEDCCVAEPELRVPEPVAPCPVGAMVRIGRNERGFGRVDNCHSMRLGSIGQADTSHLQYNIEARCLNTSAPQRLSARLETDTRILRDFDAFIDLIDRGDGWAEERRALLFIPNSNPLSLEGEEAQLRVRLTDVDGVTVEHTLRIRLTTGFLPDLPEIQ